MNVPVFVPATNGAESIDPNSAVKVDVINGKTYIKPEKGFMVTLNGEEITEFTEYKDGDIVSAEKSTSVNTDTVRAVADATTANKFALYVSGAQRALSADEVKAAIAVAKGKAVAKLKDDMTGGTFADGQPFTVDTTDGKSATKPGQLFQVTILGKSSYVYANEKVEVPGSAKFLVKEGDTKTFASGEQVNIASGKATMPAASSDSSDADYTLVASENNVFVEAAFLNATNLSTLIDSFDLWYMGEDDYVQFAATNVYVVAGLPVVATVKAPLTPAKAGIMVNFTADGDVVASATYNSRGAFDEPVEFNLNTSSKSGGLELDAAEGITVSLDGEILGTFNVGDKVPVSPKFVGAKLYAMVVNAGKEEITTTPLTTAETPAGMTYTLVSGDLTKAQATGGVLKIVSGVTVAAQADFGVYSDAKCKEEIEPTDVIAAGSTVYLQPSDGTDPVLNAFAGKAVASAPELTEEEAAGFYKAGVWSFVAEGIIEANTYEIAVQLPGYDKDATPVDVATKTGALEVSVDVAGVGKWAGFTADDDFAAEWFEPRGDDTAEVLIAVPAAGATHAVTLKLDEPEINSNKIVVKVIADGNTKGSTDAKSGQIKVTITHDGMEYWTVVDIVTAVAS